MLKNNSFFFGCLRSYEEFIANKLVSWWTALYYNVTECVSKIKLNFRSLHDHEKFELLVTAKSHVTRFWSKND